MAVTKHETLMTFWPDIYTHEECHKVQEERFENRF